jgi:hypothetical protein
MRPEELYAELTRIFRERGFGWLIAQVEGGFLGDETPEQRLYALTNALMSTLEAGIGQQQMLLERLGPYVKGGVQGVVFRSPDVETATPTERTYGQPAPEVYEVLDFLRRVRGSIG